MDAAWEGIFLLLVLKIPLIYLCAVVWWAIRAEPVEGGSGRRARPSRCRRAGGTTGSGAAAPARPAPTATSRASARNEPGRPPREQRPASEPRRADTIAGFLCAFALALSLVAIARTPALLAPVAILVALVAARMSQAHQKLAAWAVGVATRRSLSA